MAGKEIRNPEELLRRVDYKQWFSDGMISAMNLFMKRYVETEKEAEANELSQTISANLLAYSLMVNYMYKYSDVFKRQIDGSKEYSNNFAIVKAWLDKRGQDVNYDARELVMDMLEGE